MVVGQVHTNCTKMNNHAHNTPMNDIKMNISARLLNIFVELGIKYIAYKAVLLSLRGATADCHIKFMSYSWRGVLDTDKTMGFFK